jgi:hypothetical protein
MAICSHVSELHEIDMVTKTSYRFTATLLTTPSIVRCEVLKSILTKNMIIAKERRYPIWGVQVDGGPGFNGSLERNSNGRT